VPCHAIVELVEKLANGRVEFAEREEPPVPERSKNPALGDLISNFYFCFIARLVGSGRNNRRVVVPCKIGIGSIDRRLVKVGLRDAGLQIVGNDLGGGAAEKVERTDMRSGPVRQALRPGGARIGVAGGTEQGDEQLHGTNFASQSVQDIDGLPGIVDEHLVAGDMDLPRRGEARLRPDVGDKLPFHRQ